MEYKNWPNGKKIKRGYEVVDEWVVPKEYAPFMPPEEITSDPYFGGVIYLFDGTGYNLRTGRTEDM